MEHIPCALLVTGNPGTAGGRGPTYPEGLFLQVGIGELQDHGEVDGLGTHPAWLLVEIHLLENLQEKEK